jgi:hypothetical protein
MNSRESKMVELLKKLKDKNNILSVKAEFEAEGTRIDEFYRLVDIARKANVNISLKIGGCEAVRDLMEAKQIGVDAVIAPMIESSYALSKFIEAKNKVFSTADQQDVNFLFNIETINAFHNLDDILAIASQEKELDGVVFGRVDFTLSLKLNRDAIGNKEITNYCIATAKKVKNSSLDFVVGGAVSIDTLSSLKDINACFLSRFETRKVIFDSESLNSKNIESGLLDAVYFELLWLINKKEYYKFISIEDESRIKTLESRWNLLKTNDFF